MLLNQEVNLVLLSLLSASLRFGFTLGLGFLGLLSLLGGRSLLGSALGLALLSLGLALRLRFLSL